MTGLCRTGCSQFTVSQLHDVELARTRRGQQPPESVSEVDGGRMHREQDGAALDPADVLGPLGRNAGVLQDRRHAAGDVAGGLAEPGRERTGGDNRPDAGRTTAIAASTWPPSSPRRAAARESSISAPGVASICSASAPSSSWLRDTTEICSRVTPAACRARAAAAAAAVEKSARTRGCDIGGMLLRPDHVLPSTSRLSAAAPPGPGRRSGSRRRVPASRSLTAATHARSHAAAG